MACAREIDGKRRECEGESVLQYGPGNAGSEGGRYYGPPGRSTATTDAKLLLTVMETGRAA